MKRITLLQSLGARTARFAWVGWAGIATLFIGVCVRNAEGKEASIAHQYAGMIGGSPIRMTLARDGQHITGSYRYVRSGAFLRLEGDLQDGRARLQEIYGQRSRTGVITARLNDDGTLQGKWTKPDGSGALSFRAAPVGSAAQAEAAPARAPRRTSRPADMKAHRTGATNKQEISSDTRRAGEGSPKETQATGDFLRAVQRGDAGRARELLENDPRLSVRDKEGRTALIIACRFHNEESEGASFASVEERQRFVRLLLSQGADPNARDKRGYTPLMYAAASWGAGDPIIRMLLDAGADVNARNMYQGTTLMIATGKYGHVSTVQLLVDSGADVNLKDKFGHTALSYARSHHAPASVRVLQRAGAED